MTDYKLVPVESIKRAMYALERFANDTLAGRNSAHELRELLAAAPAVQGDLVTEEVTLFECVSCNHLYQSHITRCDCMPEEQKFNRWLARPESAEQRPAPDVAGLVEALELAAKALALAG